MRSTDVHSGQQRMAEAEAPQVHLWETGIIRITRHPQMVGQALWCLAHTIWIGNSFMVTTSLGLMAHHLFGCWHGDRRLYAKYGEVQPPRDAFPSLQPRACRPPPPLVAPPPNALHRGTHVPLPPPPPPGIRGGAGPHQHPSLCCHPRWPPETSRRLLQRVSAGSLRSGAQRWPPILPHNARFPQLKPPSACSPEVPSTRRPASSPTMSLPSAGCGFHPRSLCGEPPSLGWNERRMVSAAVFRALLPAPQNGFITACQPRREESSLQDRSCCSPRSHRFILSSPIPYHDAVRLCLEFLSRCLDALLVTIIESCRHVAPS